MNPRLIGVGALVVVVLGIIGGVGYNTFGSNRAVAQPVSATRTVTDVPYGVASKARTELCVTPSGKVARDWKFADRWMKNQLSYDTYTVDGRVYNALHIVTDDPALPKGHVRFRKVLANIGDGPDLEGHSYLNTRVNGKKVTLERELLFVEFNGQLRPQARPLPACGTPRS